MARIFFIIAGEPSGDLLGAQLIEALRKKAGQSARFIGIGGERMQAAGLETIFPMSDLSVMGIAEVVPQIPKILKRIAQTVDTIKSKKPDAVITIDSPDFSFRVAKRVKKQMPAIPLIHYVAPTVWAWRAGRAKKIAKFLDAVLCLFPFEPPYFEKEGLLAPFVGHPLVTSIPQIKEKYKQEFIRKYNLDADRLTLTVLPGSRRSEIKRLVPIFKEVVSRLKAAQPEIQILMPTLPRWHDYLAVQFPEADVITDRWDEKYTAFHISDLALHASGTVALELALCGTPMITTYKVSWFTALIARIMLKTKHVNLVNILLPEPLIPEILQGDCDAGKLGIVVQNYLDDKTAMAEQKKELINLKNILATKSKTPATAAATEVYNILKDYA